VEEVAEASATRQTLRNVDHPPEQPQVRAANELEELVGDALSAAELLSLGRVDALLRSAVRWEARVAPKPEPMYRGGQR
jgi:hypothetical protein